MKAFANKNLLTQLLFSSQRNSTSMVCIAQRSMKSSPKINPEEDFNKINSFNGDLAAYFEDLMRRRPQTATGYINLPKENFKRMVERAQNETDLNTLVNAHANYLGHRNILPHSYVDLMIKKALEMGNPNTMLEVLKLHAELAYTPSVSVLASYLAHYAQGPYEEFKGFFNTLKGNYYNVKPAGLHTTAIELASTNKDSKTVIAAYLDILDYKKTGLTAQHFQQVYEA